MTTRAWHTDHHSYTLAVTLMTPSKIYTWTGDPLAGLSEHILECYDFEIHINFIWR